MNTHYGSHIDDGTGTLTHHYGETSVDKVECRLEVDGDHGIPLLLGHTHHQTVLGDTGVVDEDIDTAEIFHHLLHYLVSLLKICCVGSVALAFHTESGNLFLGLLSILVDYEICECDICAFSGKLEGNGFTDASGSSCDESCFTL